MRVPRLVIGALFHDATRSLRVATILLTAQCKQDGGNEQPALPPFIR